ncbi:MAG: hypothetical protein KF773_42465 [Deltaproteobacteria bacterium]|nr:hypothetical protein [Deltaproteobacteria bacterium]MCW5804892.1 hypothetical protein [Deltaproteobacteria bacterium]
MTSLSAAFDELIAGSFALEASCLHERARSAVRVCRESAVESFVAIAALEEQRVVDEEGACTVEAYRSVLSFGMMLGHLVRAGRDASAEEHARMGAAVGAMLDALGPYVLPHERALRRVLLEQVAVDVVVSQLRLPD